MATKETTEKKVVKVKKEAVVKETFILTPVITEKSARTQKSSGYVYGVPVNATKS